jgi:hypothetical protein
LLNVKLEIIPKEADACLKHNAGISMEMLMKTTTSLRLAGFPALIRTQHLPNADIDPYR